MHDWNKAGEAQRRAMWRYAKNRAALPFSVGRAKKRKKKKNPETELKNRISAQLPLTLLCPPDCVLGHSWRCSARWWPWSRPATWCWRTTCRTTSGSSSSSSWARCSPRTPEWRTSSRRVRRLTSHSRDTGSLSLTWPSWICRKDKWRMTISETTLALWE